MGGFGELETRELGWASGEKWDTGAAMDWKRHLAN